MISHASHGDRLTKYVDKKYTQPEAGSVGAAVPLVSRCHSAYDGLSRVLGSKLEGMSLYSSWEPSCCGLPVGIPLLAQPSAGWTRNLQIFIMIYLQYTFLTSSANGIYRFFVGLCTGTGDSIGAHS